MWAVVKSYRLRRRERSTPWDQRVLVSMIYRKTVGSVPWKPKEKKRFKEKCFSTSVSAIG